VAVFDDLRQGVKNIEFLSDPTAGAVRCNPFWPELYFCRCRSTSGRYPRIVFHLVTATADILHHELSGGASTS
jgi:hypothetical protein